MVASPGLGQHAEQQMLGADELVLHRLGLGLRGVEHDAQPRRQAGLGAAVRLGLPPELLAQGPSQRGRIGVELLQDGRHDAVGLLDERHEQMLGLDLRVIQLARELRRRDAPPPAPSQ